MDFELRLSILRQAGMLSDEDYQKLQDVIRYFQEKYDLTLTEENASSMIISALRQNSGPHLRAASA